MKLFDFEESSTGCPPQLFSLFPTMCPKKYNHLIDFSGNFKSGKLKKGVQINGPKTPSAPRKDKEEARFISSSYIFQPLTPILILFETI